jgi:hypothetical protein
MYILHISNSIAQIIIPWGISKPYTQNKKILPHYQTVLLMLFQQWDYKISSPTLVHVCRKLHFLDEISKYHKCEQYESCVKLGSEIYLTT